MGVAHRVSTDLTTLRRKVEQLVPVKHCHADLRAAVLASCFAHR